MITNIMSVHSLRIKVHWSVSWLIFLIIDANSDWFIFRFSGLIADGIHSLSDLIADFVVLFANKKSRKPSDSDHHYGHWRTKTVRR
jgi:divalent metal cation (Fe/Co/Zn/Cd) transporter